MCRWIRLFCVFSLMAAGLVVQTPAARGRVSLIRLAELQGRCVMLERADGSWLLVRILRVERQRIVVELEDGNRGVVRPRAIARVRPAWQGRPRGPFPHPRPGDDADWRVNHKLRVEWIGARVALGMWSDLGLDIAAFGELTLFTMHWRHLYWEIVRIGGGIPQFWHWGTALGYPLHLDDRGRHELRLGVHVTFYDGFMPTLSGGQLYYMYRPSHQLGLQIGLMQTSFPFTLTLTLGVSM